MPRLAHLRVGIAGCGRRLRSVIDLRVAIVEALPWPRFGQGRQGAGCGLPPRLYTGIRPGRSCPFLYIGSLSPLTDVWLRYLLQAPSGLARFANRSVCL